MNIPCVLVTGANGGIGQAIARYFLEKNQEAFVYLGVRSNRDQAEALASEFPHRCEPLSLDVTSTDDWERALASVEQSGRAINTLVNNAGHHDDHLLATMPKDSWHSVIDSNLTATFLGCQAVTRGMMLQRFGRIINIASLSALLAPMGQANYSAAKAGVVAMTQSFAKEVARMGITVNSICPGYIETAALAEMNDDQKKAQKRSIPMRRFGQPNEVAAAVFFLASVEAAYITGAALKIDGGIF
jgi:3-oxoacyl-[acyl-carrier protein] reductase